MDFFDSAEFAAHCIFETYEDFKKTLGNDEYPEVIVPTAGGSWMHAHSMRWIGLSTLIFYGTVEGHSAVVVQHVAQLNFLVQSQERIQTSRPLGFRLCDE